jgi:Cu-Zn family superoxide dismutase
MQGLLVLIVIAALITGCDTLSKGPYASAQFVALNGSGVWGRVTFHQAEGKTFLGSDIGYSAPVAQAMAETTAGKVFVRADVNGLTPNRAYGFTLHEHGDCSANGTKVGGHFNPDGKLHGRYDRPDRHVGDLPNLEANGEGTAMLMIQATAFTVEPGPRSVVKRAIVIHERPDDFSTQPDGNSGRPIGCGVIRSMD